MSNVRTRYALFEEFIQWADARRRTDHHYQVLFRGVSSINYDLEPGGWRLGAGDYLIEWK
jgi:hypothetical protein